MKKSVFLWLCIVVLTCGAGATVHFWDGWLRIVTLVIIALILAVVTTMADYTTKELHGKDLTATKVLYIAAAVVATWPLLVYVVADYPELDAVAVTTISLIGVSVRRALQD